MQYNDGTEKAQRNANSRRLEERNVFAATGLRAIFEKTAFLVGNSHGSRAERRLREEGQRGAEKGEKRSVQRSSLYTHRGAKIEPLSFHHHRDGYALRCPHRHQCGDQAGLDEEIRHQTHHPHETAAQCRSAAAAEAEVPYFVF